jgi:hypothetical protein
VVGALAIFAILHRTTVKPCMAIWRFRVPWVVANQSSGGEALVAFYKLDIYQCADCFAETNLPLNNGWAKIT